MSQGPTSAAPLGSDWLKLQTLSLLLDFYSWTEDFGILRQSQPGSNALVEAALKCG